MKACLPIWLCIIAADALAFAAPPLAETVRVDAVSVTIPQGTWTLGHREVRIKDARRFFVRGAGLQQVLSEPLLLSTDAPAGLFSGTKLKGPAAGVINSLDSLVDASLVIRKQPEGEALVRGKDYLVSAPHALVGLGAQSKVQPDTVVYASYAYRVERVDSIAVDPEGKLYYYEGLSAVVAAKPPEIPPNQLRLANLYRPYGAESLEPEQVMFIESDGRDIRTGSTPGRIPKTLEKLRSGKPVTIVCWGDSVTAGGDIPNPADTYVERFRQALRQRFPKASIQLHNISVGGTRSVQWFDGGSASAGPQQALSPIRFGRILETKPDLVTIEFVNDVAMPPEVWPLAYARIHHELTAIGAEVILLTPHFTHPQLMNQRGCRPKENRPYVVFLRAFAQEKNLGLADASARWEQSWKQGLPYLTLLANRFNHPDPEGDQFFVDELLKCFQ